MKKLAPLFSALLLAACSSTQSEVPQKTAAPDQVQLAANPHAAAAQATAPGASEHATATTSSTTSSIAGSGQVPNLPKPPPPPMPPFSPGRTPRIAICNLLSVGLQPQPVKGLKPVEVCGTGFASGEMVTLSIIGRPGTPAWTVVAGSGGTFATTVVPAACRYLSGLVIARGNRGHVSNALLLPPSPCRVG